MRTIRYSEHGTIASRATKVAARRRATLCRHCLTAVPSERSEDKLVFLIDVQPVDCSRERKSDDARRSAAERMGIDDESDQVP